MTLYKKVRSRPTTFLRLFGIKIQEFDHIATKVLPLWESKLKKRYKRQGRNYKLSLENMILMLLLYYRSYVTQHFIGMLFGLDDSNVCRIIKELEPVLAKCLAIRKERHLTKEEIGFLIVDATEHPIQRPKKGQKRFYSGKKKRHTRKSEIRISKKGRIVGLSKSRPGSQHDFNIHKSEPPIHRDIDVFVDSGYQGLDKIHKRTKLPFKGTKNKPLDQEKKEHNRAISKIRVKVENVIREIKTFRIMGDTYRNRNKRHSLKLNIVAGLVNLKKGFVSI